LRSHLVSAIHFHYAVLRANFGTCGCRNAAIYQREAALKVTLSEAGHAVVKATVKNTGTAPLNLFKYGTLFDTAVEKFNVHAVKSKVPFEGMRRRVQTTNLKEDVFHLLQPGATFETEVDAATLSTLETGRYSVTAEGAIPYAVAGPTELSGKAVYYKSNNTLALSVDGERAGQAKMAISGLNERSTFQSDCAASQKSATDSALSK
jgi:deuterolysin